MDLAERAVRVKIYVGESDRYEGLPAYKAVVHYLREQGIWGATVTRGVYGFGKRSLLHTSTPLMSGSPTSSTTRSGWCCVACSRAARPVPARTTP